jgi:hypothetical protein
MTLGVQSTRKENQHVRTERTTRSYLECGHSRALTLECPLWWGVAELVSAPAWKTGENGFEPRPSPQF